MYPLALLSLMAVAIIIERSISLPRTLADLSPQLVEKVVALCEDGRSVEALAAAQTGNGPVAAVLVTILRRTGAPPLPMSNATSKRSPNRTSIALEHRLPVLDTTTTISPLLGLLGTLFGMIATFRAIATSKNEGANDSILAGVGEALYATATGLSIAVVCFVAYNLFAARSRQSVAQTEQAATRLINVLRASG